MRYFGGKQRIAKRISKYLIDNFDKSIPYLEPFVGGASVISLMNEERERERVGADINQSLIMLLNECKDEIFPYPEEISEELYKQYKNDPDSSAMKAFIGFGCSFAGKWFGGYAREGNRNFAKNASCALRKRAEGFKNVEFICVDYRSLNPSGKLIYCDPPYKSTTKIFNREFDSEEFWHIMRKWSKDNIVIISEYQAPDDFKTVLEIQTKTDINGKDNSKLPRMEKLFRLNLF